MTNLLELAKNQMTESWFNALYDELQKDYIKNIETQMEFDKKNNLILPPEQNIFNAFSLCEFDNIKVVILGQDPYPNKMFANGFCFSVNANSTKLPMSLKNIFCELSCDLNLPPKKNGDLTTWAKQGVLLLNSVLTVVEGKPLSHSKLGWQNFTDTVIRKLNEKQTPVVFVLWGNYAKSKACLVSNDKHLIISSNHPSPLSANRGFFGSKPFSKINDFLRRNKIDEIAF